MQFTSTCTPTLSSAQSTPKLLLVWVFSWLRELGKSPGSECINTSQVERRMHNAVALACADNHTIRAMLR